MANTPATSYATNMAKLVGNTGGAIQQLLETYTQGGRVRAVFENLVLNAQAANAVIGVGSLPVPCRYLGTIFITDTSLGTSTIELGDAGNGDAANLVGAFTLTATDTPTWKGKAAAIGAPITAGNDAATGNAVTPQAPAQRGGAGMYDLVLTVGTAALPAAGNLNMIHLYVVD